MSDGFVLEQAPNSICVLRLSALGDVCHMVAVVQSIQVTYPAAKITWIIGKAEAPLVSDLPGIEFILFDKAKGWRAYLDVSRQLGQRRFDVLLHAQVALRASLVSLFVRAKHRIGFDRKRAKDAQWLFTREKIRSIPRQHVLEGLQEFARALGVAETSPKWTVPIPPECHAFVRDLVPQGFVVIHPAASCAERNWNVAGYAQLAEYIKQNYPLQVVITGGKSSEEMQLAASIESMCTVPIINLVGKTSLKQCLAILEKAQLVIGPDTGPIHMATMVGTDVIGLYACSNPGRTGPYLGMATTVNQYPVALAQYHQLTEATAPWGMRVHGKQVMELITLDAVLEQVNAILSRQSLKAVAQ